MIYYIAKLKEKYDFPYIPSPYFDPKEVYIKYGGGGERLWLIGMRNEAHIDDKKLIEFFLTKDTTTIKIVNAGLIGAVKGNNKQLVNYFLEKGANVNIAVHGIDKDIDEEMIKFLLSKGADINFFILYAMRKDSNLNLTI